MSDEARPDAAHDIAESTHANETDMDNTDTAHGVESRPEAPPDGANEVPADNAESFPREYVETLRKESAGYRERAKAAEDRADQLARRLHAALVNATGKLVDPDALPFDVEHLDDAQKLSAAIEALTDAKPYLKPRKVTGGDAGQGSRGGADTSFNLLELLRNR